MNIEREADNHNPNHPEKLPTSVERTNKLSTHLSVNPQNAPQSADLINTNLNNDTMLKSVPNIVFNERVKNENYSL